MLRQWFLLSATLAVALFACHFMAFLTLVSLWLVLPAIALAPLFAVFAVLAGFVGIHWLGWFTDSLFAVAETTSVGAGRIEEWPQCTWWDGIGSRSTLFVVSALSITLFAAYQLDVHANCFGIADWLVIAALSAVLFPIILLSMADTDSPLVPISGSVWHSLWNDWPAWCLFFLASASLIESVAWIVERLWDWAGNPFTFFAWHGPVAAPIIAAGLLAYFRMLGLLTLECSKRAARRDVESD